MNEQQFAAIQQRWSDASGSDLLLAHQEAASAKSRLDQYIHASQALKLAAARLLEIP